MNVSGAQYQAVLRIYSSKIGENNSTCCYPIKITSALGDIFWKNISSTTQISFINALTGTVLKRTFKVFDSINKSAIVWINLPVSIGADTIIFMQWGPLVVDADSALTFTNDSMVGHYSLEETDGTMIDDCGNYNLSNSGMTLGATGRLGNCASADNTATKRISAAGPGAFDCTDAFSGFALVKINSSATNSNYIFGKYNNTGPVGWKLYITAGSNLTFYMRNGTPRMDVYRTIAPKGIWHLAWCSNSGTGTMAGMSCGVDGSTTWTNEIDTLLGTSILNAVNFSIGQEYNVTTNVLNGSVDEVSLYNVAKTALHFKTLYNAIFKDSYFFTSGEKINNRPPSLFIG